MTGILYTLAMISLGALVGGYLYKRRFDKDLEKVKSEAQKSLDAMYHKGFESGMEKAQADIVAMVGAHQDAEVQEEARIAKLAEEIGIEATLETHECGNGCDHNESTYTISIPKTKKKKPAKKKKTKKSKK